MNNKLIFCLYLFLLTSAKPALSTEMPAAASISIEYVLGRSRYRFVVEPQTPSAESTRVIEGHLTRDGHELEHGTLSESQYSEFLKQVTEFISASPKKSYSPEKLCRRPFSVSLRNGSKDKSTPPRVYGCRTGDGGAFSKLVKAGEFFLYKD